MSEKNWKTRLLTSSVFAGALIASAALPAIAQTEDEPVATTAPAADETEARQEKVTVTGSRLALADFQAISPVTSVSSEAIELNATLTLETLLNELPQVIPGNTVTSNNSGGEDFATIDLRGLGPARTLVLVDGERVPGSSTTGVVDLNSIPAGLVDRVEVVTGGASAVYGSDAIAGVVNFILKDDYEGAQVTVGGGAGFDGNAKYETADFLFGGNFDNGKGNMVAYASYFNRDGVFQSQYDYSRVSQALVYGYQYDYSTSSGRYTGVIAADSLEEYLAARAALLAVPANANQANFAGTFVGGGSATPPWGSISNSSANPFQNLSTNAATAGQFAAANTDCDPATAPVAVNGGNLSFNDSGQLTPYFSSRGCAVPIRANGSSRYNYAPDNYIYLPAERFGVQTFGNYDVTDTIHMKTFLSYVRSITQVQLAATPITGLSIPVSSPAIAGADGIVGTADDPHPDLSAALNSRPTPGANFTYAWRSNGVGPRKGEFINSNLLGRVTFDGSITEDWEWNASAGWGQGQFNATLQNNVNRPALLQGVAGCANVPVSAQLPGCVNVDIFGPPSLTPDAAAASFIRTDVQTSQSIEQIAFSGFVRGPLFKLPAGEVSSVFGLEYRQDDVRLVVDDAQRRGEIAGFNAVQNINGQLDVYEAYTEVSIPILADLPMAEELSVDLGYRASDYSTVGSIESYKYGFRYAPIDWLRFRGVYNKAARAPSALESFQAGDQGFPSFVDPCRAGNTSGDATLRAFCGTNGAIGAGFVPAANLATFAASNSQVQAFSFGNPNLSPETGETSTIGLVFEPDFLPVGTLRSTVDWFNIKLTDAIVSRGAQTILNSCYNNLGTTAQSASDCQQIVRDPATGQVTSVNTSLTNSLGETEISGWDIQVDYELGLDEVVSTLPGTVGLNLLLTLTDEWLVNGDDFVGTTEAGIGAATPEYKAITTVDYRLDDWTFQLRHNYVPGLAQDYPGGTFEGTLAPDTPELSNFDASVAWDVTDRLRIVGNVSNLTDEFPPQTITGTFDQANTDAALYAPWVIGRTFSVQARLKF
ncbi:TonB-dependent receptor [Hyphomonas sp.]|uniref:TonB-dependent receptor domain-containing protein n=1 Tax=Hyphomonas sp. TaxID=87 RepID=UPI001D38337F|nr:TonB-dependent receptor [Hyphomonas sp.]MBU3920089.1 TonB-dependent receptor [Alphaproteobacteria bacterium]MBU4060968.1 TonB-dependent receptor [Alphaproteobacteria bacterium]MBU4166176.1 TonB-dependent receptor [Alphaproteobacteria bacterium]